MDGNTGKLNGEESSVPMVYGSPYLDPKVHIDNQEIAEQGGELEFGGGEGPFNEEPLDDTFALEEERNEVSVETAQPQVAVEDIEQDTEKQGEDEERQESVEPLSETTRPLRPRGRGKGRGRTKRKIGGKSGLKCHLSSCVVCERGAPGSFGLRTPSWVEVARVAMYALTEAYLKVGRKYFHIRSDIFKFIDAHWNELCGGKTRTATWGNTISAEFHRNTPGMFKSGIATKFGKGFWALAHPKISPYGPSEKGLKNLGMQTMTDEVEDGEEDEEDRIECLQCGANEAPQWHEISGGFVCDVCVEPADSKSARKAASESTTNSRSTKKQAPKKQRIGSESSSVEGSSKPRPSRQRAPTVPFSPGGLPIPILNDPKQSKRSRDNSDAAVDTVTKRTRTRKDTDRLTTADKEEKLKDQLSREGYPLEVEFSAGVSRFQLPRSSSMDSDTGQWNRTPVASPQPPGSGGRHSGGTNTMVAESPRVRLAASRLGAVGIHVGPAGMRTPPHLSRVPLGQTKTNVIVVDRLGKEIRKLRSQLHETRQRDKVAQELLSALNRELQGLRKAHQETEDRLSMRDAECKKLNEELLANQLHAKEFEQKLLDAQLRLETERKQNNIWKRDAADSAAAESLEALSTGAGPQSSEDKVMHSMTETPPESELTTETKHEDVSMLPTGSFPVTPPPGHTADTTTGPTVYYSSSHATDTVPMSIPAPDPEMLGDTPVNFDALAATRVHTRISLGSLPDGQKDDIDRPRSPSSQTTATNHDTPEPVDPISPVDPPRRGRRAKRGRGRKGK